MMIMMKVDDDDDDGCCQCIVMKVILVKEVMSCDVLPVAICINLSSLPRLCGGWSQTGHKFCRRVFGSLFTHGRLLGFAVPATKAKLPSHRPIHTHRNAKMSKMT